MTPFAAVRLRGGSLRYYSVSPPIRTKKTSAVDLARACGMRMDDVEHLVRLHEVSKALGRESMSKAVHAATERARRNLVRRLQRRIDPAQNKTRADNPKAHDVRRVGTSETGGSIVVPPVSSGGTATQQ
jgi:hypothetical protein